jgi:hypothetical protein
MATAISIPRPKRWDRPFGPDMTEGDVLRVVLTLRVFGAIDQTQFPGTLSLQGRRIELDLPPGLVDACAST